MSGLLSHSECEALLSAAKSTSLCSRETLPPILKHEASADWTPLNFFEPAPLPAKAVELLVAIQTGLCQRLEKRFQSLLGAAIRFRPVGLEVVRFDAYGVDSLSRTCQFFSPAEPLPWRVSWEPEMANTLIGLLLGGDRAKPSRSTSEPLSEIENLLLIRLCKTFLEVFDNTASIASLTHPRTPTIEYGPTIIPPELAAASFLRVHFEVSCNDRSGLVECWLPSASVTEGRFREVSVPESEPLTGPTPNPASCVELLAHSPKIAIAAELARIKLKTIQVSELTIGDILMTDVSQFDDASLSLGGRRLFRCAIGALDGKKSVRLSTSASSDVD